MNKLMKENGTVLGILLLWLFIHFILLMVGGVDNTNTESFYPFSERNLKNSYDITEFLVYGVGPIVLFIIIKLVKNEKN